MVNESLGAVFDLVISVQKVNMSLYDSFGVATTIPSAMSESTSVGS